jgi:hypothetical protein
MKGVALMEFRCGDGTSTTAEVGALKRYTRGDVVEHDGGSWVMYDRLDRDGVTVHLFAPVSPVAVPSAPLKPRRSGPYPAAG